jgi:hypothetical protein
VNSSITQGLNFCSTLWINAGLNREKKEKSVKKKLLAVCDVKTSDKKVIKKIVIYGLLTASKK